MKNIEISPDDLAKKIFFTTTGAIAVYIVGICIVIL